jgi:hypothetical protein
MNAALHQVRDIRGPAARWAGLAALVLLAACGDERRQAPAAGTEGATATDSAAVVPPDTIRSAIADSSPAAPAPDTAATQQALRPATPPAPAKPAKPAESAPSPQPAASKTEPSQPAPSKPEPSQDTATTAVPPRSPASGQDTAAATQGQAGGASETATADAPLRDAYHQAPKDTVDQATYNGWKQFNLNCARCHGEDVAGTTIAPHLILSLKPDGPINTQEAFVQVVCAGRPEKGMPSWCALGIDPAKINEIYSYVKGRSEGKLHPGRPARKPEG